jgi:U4/U6 small nuclear ribonucleoprotein PRP31
MMGKSTGTIRNRDEDKGILKKYKQKSLGTSGLTSGLSSSLAFTPVQGIELENPDAQAQKVKEANEKYFSSFSTFKKVKDTK